MQLPDMMLLLRKNGMLVAVALMLAVAWMPAHIDALQCKICGPRKVEGNEKSTVSCSDPANWVDRNCTSTVAVANMTMVCGRMAFYDKSNQMNLELDCLMVNTTMANSCTPYSVNSKDVDQYATSSLPGYGTNPMRCYCNDKSFCNSAPRLAGSFFRLIASLFLIVASKFII